MKYVVGFMFSENGNAVALIHKKKPVWQKNFWNGIGGKIEGDELPQIAMSREFMEEAGVITIPGQWKSFYNTVDDPDENVCTFFKYFSDDVYDVRTMESESVGIFVCDPDHSSVINSYIRLKLFPNLSWLIPMALDKLHVRSEGKNWNEIKKSS